VPTCGYAAATGGAGAEAGDGHEDRVALGHVAVTRPLEGSGIFFYVIGASNTNQSIVSWLNFEVWLNGVSFLVLKSVVISTAKASTNAASHLGKRRKNILKRNKKLKLFVQASGVTKQYNTKSFL
jgi:hypothetical protein